jgi:hypothetical protein
VDAVPIAKQKTQAKLPGVRQSFRQTLRHSAADAVHCAQLKPVMPQVGALLRHD